MHQQILPLLMLCLIIPGLGWTSDLKLNEIKAKLRAHNLSQAAISLNVPIDIPAGAHPFTTTETRLMASLIRPDNTASRRPTILVTTAYRHEFMTVLGISLLKNGYNFLTVDCRGTGSSADGWAMLDPAEHYDLAYIVDRWIPAQSWSNGQVGMYGPSYMAITQMQTMGLIERDADGEPTHLKAAFPETSMADAYRDICLLGGNFNIEFGALWLSLTDALALMPPSQVLNLGLLSADINAPLAVWYDHLAGADAGLEALVQPEHALDCAWYDAKSPMIYWPDNRDEGLAAGDGQSGIPARLPVFLSGGWFDIFTNGTLKNYMYALQKQAPGDKALIMGEWYHLGASFMPDIACALNGQLPTRWFDWKIKGKADGFMHEFPVILKVMGDGRWRAEQNWPLPAGRLAARTLYLSKRPAGKISLDWFNTSNQRYSLTANPNVADYRDANPVMQHAATLSGLHGLRSRAAVRWSMGATAILPGGDVEDERLDELHVPTFTTAPLAADLEIIGPLKLHFWARTRFEGPAATLKPEPLMQLINQRYGLETNLFELQFNERTVQWVVEINDVGAAGQARNITSGWLRASHRPYDPLDPTRLDPAYRPFDPYYDRPDRQPAAIEEGRLYEYVVEIWPTCNVFKQDHRIRLSLSGSDFPHLIPLLTPSINELVIDAGHPARLDFATTTADGEGRSWKWIGDDDQVSDYLMQHCDSPADADPANLAAAALVADAAATNAADTSDGGRCFIASASRR